MEIIGLLIVWISTGTVVNLFIALDMVIMIMLMVMITAMMVVIIMTMIVLSPPSTQS